MGFQDDIDRIPERTTHLSKAISSTAARKYLYLSVAETARVANRGSVWVSATFHSSAMMSMIPFENWKSTTVRSNAQSKDEEQSKPEDGHQPNFALGTLLHAVQIARMLHFCSDQTDPRTNQGELSQHQIGQDLGFKIRKRGRAARRPKRSPLWI
jgi:hypothetical protein